MGALTLTVQNRGIVGDLRYATVDVAFSNSYATGGDTGLTAAALGWDSVVLALITPTGGYSLDYVYASGNVIAYGTHTHALHFDNADVADGATTRINAGTNLLGANTGSDLAVAGVANTTGDGGIVDGGPTQVRNATNLSTSLASVRCLLFGR